MGKEEFLRFCMDWFALNAWQVMGVLLAGTGAIAMGVVGLALYVLLRADKGARS
jgi:hypothetical protein